MTAHAPDNSSPRSTATSVAEVAPDLLARRFAGDSRSQGRIVWDSFRTNRPAYIAIWIIAVVALLGVFAPLVANHRPLLLWVSPAAVERLAETLGVSPALIDAGLSLPLVASLRSSDWILILGLIQLLIAAGVRRQSGTDRPFGQLAVGVLVAMTLAPVALAGLLSPALHRWLTGTGPAPWNDSLLGSAGATTSWTIVIAVGLGGLLIAMAAILALRRGRTDALGSRPTGARLRRCLAGSLLLLVAASLIGTQGRREVDPYSYRLLAAQEGVTAVFPVVQHDFTAAEFYMRNQPPGGPYTRVQPASGSKAAADLGLTDARRQAALSDELAPEIDTALRPDTPLQALRQGEGVRLRGDGIADLTVIGRDLRPHKISLGECLTIADVLHCIERDTSGAITAAINSEGTRLELLDRSDPAPTNYLGTDDTGSDVASRLVHATRVALSIGFVSTGIALFIGVTMGALMGYFGGWVDLLGMRIIEIFMAIPRLFLLLTIIAFIPPRWNEYMLYAMMAVIGATSWMGAARFIRAEFMKMRHQDYVLAAQVCGLPMRSILFRHMLPNGVTPVLVDASFRVAAAIFVETGLSFLGFGIKPPNPSWGQMLASAVDPNTGVFHWWLAAFPGIMIFIAVFGFNLIGDALRDAIDPKLKKESVI